MAEAASRTTGWAGQDLTARGVVMAAGAAMLAVTLLDLVDGRLGIVFSVGFVLVALTAPLSVDGRALFTAGMLPPALLVAAVTLVAVVHPPAITADGLADDAGLVGRVVAGVIDHGLTLVIGYALAIAVIVARSAAARRV